MIRAISMAAAALLMLGAKAPATVDYRLSAVSQDPGAPPRLEIELRFRGDADGETRLALPDGYGSGREAWRFLSDLTVRGAQVSAPDPGHRVLRHRPNAQLTVRYRVRTAYDQDPRGGDGEPYRGPLIRPDGFAVIGEFVFAAPEGRESQPASFRTARLPKGWRFASDLQPAATGRPLVVSDLVESISLGGPAVQVAERAVPGGVLRAAQMTPGEVFPASLIDDLAKLLAAQRGFWRDPPGPYLVALVPLAPPGRASGADSRGDASLLYAAPGAAEGLPAAMAQAHARAVIANQVGRKPPPGREAEAFGLTEGLTDVVTLRTLIRAGLATQQETVGRMSDALKAYDNSPVRAAPASRIAAEFRKDPQIEALSRQRGLLLALKWDEEIRRKTGGKADLVDVIRRMRDHYRRFPSGQGPDMTAGLVSAAWVTAGVDLRPDIARYVERGEPIPLPESLFDGCLEVRFFTRPAFDSGFDHVASVAAKAVRGVRRGGPAWNSGLRNGMALTAWKLQPGDTTREIELTVQPAGRSAKPRLYRYWPYGDADLSTRSLALKPGLAADALAACGRRISGL